MGGAASALRAEQAVGPGTWASGSREPGTGDSGADALEELRDEIARLAAHMHAARSRFPDLVAESDRREGRKAGGHRSCARWLTCRTGHGLRTDRGWVVREDRGGSREPPSPRQARREAALAATAPQ